MRVEGGPDVGGYGAGCLPFEGVGDEVLFEEGAAADLE